MARIRSIHPGQWADGDFVGCSPLGRLLCIALRNHADDRGVFRWKPMQIKMICLPGDNCDIEILLKELVENDQLVQFEADGKTYAVIRDFCQWQRPKKPVVSHPLPDHLLSVAGVKVDTEKSLRQRKCEDQGGACFYCEIEITHYSKKSNSLELDHKLPRSRGGDDSENNLVATCRKCNRAKNDMSDSEYREWLAKKGSRIPKDDAKDGSRISVAPRNSPRKKQREEVGGREERDTSGISLSSPNSDSENYSLCASAEEKKERGSSPSSPGAALPDGAHPSTTTSEAKGDRRNVHSLLDTPAMRRADAKLGRVT